MLDVVGWYATATETDLAVDMAIHKRVSWGSKSPLGVGPAGRYSAPGPPLHHSPALPQPRNWGPADVSMNGWTPFRVCRSWRLMRPRSTCASTPQSPQQPRTCQCRSTRAVGALLDPCAALRDSGSSGVCVGLGSASAAMQRSPHPLLLQSHSLFHTPCSLCSLCPLPAELHVLDDQPQSIFVQAKYTIEVRKRQELLR